MTLNGETPSSSQIGLAMPTYNCEKFIADAVESLQRQTFPDFVCVIVNDGSTDGTADLAEKLIAGDARFSIVHQANQGVSAARNTGLAHLPATRYISFPDSDDVMNDDALETLWMAAEDHPDTVGVHALAEYIDSDGNPLPKGALAAFGLPDHSFADLGRNRCIATARGRFRKVSLESPSTFSSVIQNCTIYPTSISLIRRGTLDKLGPAPYDTTLPIYADWDVFTRLSRHGDLAFINKVVVRYRRHDNNVTNDTPAVWKDSRAARVKTARSPDNTPAQRATIKATWRATEAGYARNHIKHLVGAVRRGRLPNAARYLAAVGTASCRMVLGRPSWLDTRK